MHSVNTPPLELRSGNMSKLDITVEHGVTAGRCLTRFDHTATGNTSVTEQILVQRFLETRLQRYSGHRIVIANFNAT